LENRHPEVWRFSCFEKMIYFMDDQNKPITHEKVGNVTNLKNYHEHKNKSNSKKVS